MLRIISTIISISLSLFASTLLIANEVQLFQGSWEEAKAKAKQDKKMLFVFINADWCEINVKMFKDEKVFQNPEIAEFYNSNFISYVIDYDTPVYESFVKTYPINSIPS